MPMMREPDWKLLEHHLEAASSISEEGKLHSLQGAIDLILREVKKAAQSEPARSHG